MTYPPLCDPIPGVDPDVFYAACDTVRAFCGWHVAPEVEETFTRVGNGSPYLFVPSLHVTAVEAVEDGTDVGALSDFENGVLVRPGYASGSWAGWKWGYTLSVTVTHGYEVCPAGVVQVVKQLARSNARAGSGSVQVGQIRVSAPSVGSSGLDLGMEAALSPYRIIR